MSKIVLGLITAFVLLAGLLAGGPAAQAGTPGVPDTQVEEQYGVDEFYDSTTQWQNFGVVCSSDGSTFVKRLKLYVKRPSDNYYLQSDGVTFASTFYEFVSNNRSSQTDAFSGIFRLSGSGAGTCSAGSPNPSVYKQFVDAVFDDLPTGTYAFKIKTVDNEGDVQANWQGPGSDSWTEHH